MAGIVGRVALITAAQLAGLSAAVHADEELVVSVTSAVCTDYVWRGQRAAQGLVLQPQVDLRYRGFSGQVWANVTIDAKASEMTEVDLLLTWTAHTGSVSWTVTAIEYEFPTGAPGTREIAVSAALPGSWGAPRVSVFRDLDQTDGTYATLSLSKALATWHRSRLTGDISVSWGDRKNNFGYFGLRESGGNDGFVAVTLTHAVSERVSISALVRAWEIIDGGLARSARSIFGKDDGIVAAATVTLGF